MSQEKKSTMEIKEKNIRMINNGKKKNINISINN